MDKNDIVYQAIQSLYSETGVLSAEVIQERLAKIHIKIETSIVEHRIQEFQAELRRHQKKA